MPTLAEVKRGSNPEIRRTIVGQLLEYAAHASETWTAFGAAVYNHAHPEELWAMLERWFDEVSADSFAEVVSSKGVKAWAVRYEAGVQHQDVLVERLRRITSELVSL